MLLSPAPASSLYSVEFHALEAVSQYLFSLPVALSLSLQFQLLNSVVAYGNDALWQAMNFPNPFPVKSNQY